MVVPSALIRPLSAVPVVVAEAIVEAVEEAIAAEAVAAVTIAVLEAMVSAVSFFSRILLIELGGSYDNRGGGGENISFHI